MNEKNEQFGVIAFVSNLDLDTKTIYEYYKLRWEIEVNIKLEKNSIDSNVVRVHSTSGILGIRFLEKIEMIIVGRIYFKLKEKGLLENSSIRKILNELSKVHKLFNNGKWITSICTKKMYFLLNKLSVPI